MNCISCNEENARDYLVCKHCETRLHFTNRDDCRCVGCRPGPGVIARILPPSADWLAKVLTDSAPAACADHGVDTAAAV